jgi:hydrogenase/urease accessory protein HupE
VSVKRTRSARPFVRFAWSIGLAVFAWVAPATADEFRPAYLQLSQVDATTYDVLWKVPAIDEGTTLAVRPQFPAGTEDLTPIRSAFAAGATVIRWRVRVAGGLAGKEVRFSGLSNSRRDVLVRLARSDGTVQLERIPPSEPRFLVTTSPAAFEVARVYTVLGIEHILTGYDHLLFVFALLLLVEGTARLIATVTAFTIAHSLTLAGAALGFVNVPAQPVESAIALSIAFVAAEVLRARRGELGLTRRFPWLIAFTFGLLHGLGFAGALSEIGLPPLSIPTALLFFNVGVEIGQLLFIAGMLLAIETSRRYTDRTSWRGPDWWWRVPPYALGSIAMFWVIQRVSAY